MHTTVCSIGPSMSTPGTALQAPAAAYSTAGLACRKPLQGPPPLRSTTARSTLRSSAYHDEHAGLGASKPAESAGGRLAAGARSSGDRDNAAAESSSSSSSSSRSSSSSSTNPGSDSTKYASSSLRGPFRGSFLSRQASSNTEPIVTPLTALHECDPPSWPASAARQALYTDVPAERVDALYTRVVGKLPSWLKGSFYRNGPGKFEGAHAVFDGCAMVVRFRVDGASNQVVLSHRFLDTVYYQAVKDQGRIRWKMAHPPDASKSALGGLANAGRIALGALQYGMHIGDNALISIFPQGNELIAHTETVSGTYRIHPETLETLGRVEYKDSITGMVKTAHPQRLPNGDILGMAADFSPVLDTSPTAKLRLPEITVYRQSQWQADRRHKVAAVPYLQPTAPTWIHQLAVSENYAVVVQNPVFYNVKAMVLGQAADFMVFDWKPEAGSLLHVVPLLGGQIKSYRAPAFLATHWVNAFESADGRLLHLDAAVTATPALMSHWSLETVRAGPVGGKQIEASFFRRLTLDLSLPDGSFLEQRPLLQRLVPDEAHGFAFEMPSINPDYVGKPYRYAYGCCCVRPANCWNAICKLDLETGQVRVWHEPGGAAWEPIFVPRPGGRSEDDGCVLCTIMQADGRSALLVLDAKSWREVARAVCPYALPNGFHGCFVPA